MKKITLLNDNIINRISAGEIIEYPTCICRELIDNSIDALSKKIILEISNGGIDYIKISDNGIGMSYEDTILCFKKHTTSKIKTINDLNNIKTRGFRGEALASICSISYVEITTKSFKEILGTKIIIQNNSIINIEKVACQPGTTIIVKNIFQNIPVKKINLRKHNIENSYIQKIIETNAIVYPEISFQFIKDNKHIFTTNVKNKLLNNIEVFYGTSFVKKLLSLNYVYKNYIIQGYISNPKYVNKNKNIQYIFVNNRIIKSELINKAIKAAFKDFILNSENPSYILLLKSPYNKININIHPTKNKILFLEKEQIFHLIKQACENVINKNLKNIQSKIQINNISTIIENINLGIENQYMSNIDFKIFGECFHIYILVLYKNKLILIDKHAAHEKLIYNALLNKIKNKKINNIQLPNTYIFEMNSFDLNFVINNIILFKNIGFEIDIFGEKNIAVRKIPIFIDKLDIKLSIYNIIEVIKKENYILYYDQEEYIKKIISKIACRYAIKKNIIYNKIKLDNIVKKIINNTKCQYCPHGRPIVMVINKTDIDKYFKRV